MKYFAYCRKSSEGEERQALSIPAQIDEIKRVFGDTGDVEIVEWFEEKMSAKAPGRPVWSAMIKRIERGEADGIVAWHPDRLARNSVDGGWIIHLLDKRVLKDLKFVSYSYEQSPQGMFMLQIMFGQSKYYVDNLSVNVKRGMRKKIEMGWLPNLAPLGYRNDRETGTVIRDDGRFLLLRRAWELLLTRTHSISRIRKMLNEEWGFRTPVRPKTGGRPIAQSTLYKMFGNPFYAGILDWYGEWRPGKHEAMVTLEEFRRAQEILGGSVRIKPETHAFPFTGLIRCTCGLVVTAEEKIKPSGRRYVYYHCTRSRQPRCCEMAVPASAIDQCIASLLNEIHIPDEIERHLTAKLAENAVSIRKQDSLRADTAKLALAKIKQQLHALTELRIQGRIDDAEFTEHRQTLQKQELSLREASATSQDNQDITLELARSVIMFRKYAADWFLAGNTDDKRLILKTVASNSVLGGKKLSIQARIPFRPVKKTTDFPRWLANVKAIGTQEAHELIDAVTTLKAGSDHRSQTLGLSPSPEQPTN